MNSECLFCKIANGQTDTELVWQNEVAAAFRDIHPKAPVHILVVPKTHVETLDHLDHPALGNELLQGVQNVAEQAGVAGGYRVQINVGEEGGQVVPHLHLHVMGGQRFSE
jgi:histidine triad (HIT) family protein